MHSSILLIAASLAALSSAVPTPAQLAPRCGTTIAPTIMQIFSSTQPDTSFPNSVTPTSDGTFTVSQDENGGEILQGVAFTNLPPGSFGCQLQFTFDAGFPISQSAQPQMNVSTLGVGHSDRIVNLNGFTLNDLFNTPGALDTGLFGTIGPLQAGQTAVVNSEACPTDLNGGGNLAFLFSISSWVEGAQSVSFTQTPTSGIFLVHNC